MTNEEMIYYIQRMPRVFGIYGDHDLNYVGQIAERIKSQETENTKLKAEIEEYSKVITEQSKLNVEQFKQLDEQYQRIEQLHNSNLEVCEINGRLVRQNTNQGFKIKDLEKECAKLCEENAELKKEIIKKQLL